MPSAADSRAPGPDEQAARRAAGLDRAARPSPAVADDQSGVAPPADNAGAEEPEGAAGSPGAPNDVEQIHDRLPGFADAGDARSGAAGNPSIED